VLVLSFLCGVSAVRTKVVGYLGALPRLIKLTIYMAFVYYKAFIRPKQHEVILILKNSIQKGIGYHSTNCWGFTMNKQMAYTCITLN